MSFKRVCLYLLSDEWQEFIKICEREGESGSKKVREFVRGYNQRHRIGNPQMLLDGFGVKSQKECPWCGLAVDKLYKTAFISGAVVAVCKTCLDDQKAKTTVKRVVEVT